MLSRFRVLGPMMALALAAVSATPSFAAPSSCTRGTPGVRVENTWAWGQTGSWGLPGQKLTYQIDVTNYDAGCRSSSFVIGLSAPTGFSVEIPTKTINLKSRSTGYLVANVASPSVIGDGTYPLAATVQRSDSPSAVGSGTSYYKVYSSDTVAPTLYWPSVGAGQTISGRSYDVSVSANDDHAVKTIELDIDGQHMSTAVCDNIAYSCQLHYSWSLSQSGPHTVTFKALDWLGNESSLPANVTVS
jgi:hypothetical protein